MQSRASNPAYTISDLDYQLRITHAKALVLHPWILNVGLAAAKAVGLSLDHIILFDIADGNDTPLAYMTVSQLVDEGQATRKSFTERRLGQNEGRMKLAYINLSSGTTGKPKVSRRTQCIPEYGGIYTACQAVCIPHGAVIAGMIQQAHMLNQDTTPWDERKYRSGDCWYAGKPSPRHIMCWLTALANTNSPTILP